MAAYYLLLILPMFSSLSCAMVLRKSMSYYKFVLWTFFIVLIVLLALRSCNVGVDLCAYEYYFDFIAASDWPDVLDPFYVKDIEWGYVLFNKIIATFYYNFHFFLAIVAVLTVLPIAVLYAREAKLPLLTITLFINMPTFVMLSSGLRQAIAVAIGAIAFNYVKNRRPLQFLFTVSIACMFHFSALILLIMYPAYHIKISQKYLPVILALFISLAIFVRKIFLIVVQFMGPKYVSRYANIEETGAHAMLFLFFIFTLFAFIFVCENKQNDMLVGLRNFLLINLFIQAFSQINTVAMRLGYYYLIFIPILIPLIIEHMRVNDKFLLQMAHVVMVVFFFIYYFVNAHYGADILHVYPYDTFI